MRPCMVLGIPKFWVSSEAVPTLLPGVPPVLSPPLLLSISHGAAFALCLRVPKAPWPPLFLLLGVPEAPRAHPALLLGVLEVPGLCTGW